MPASSTSIIPAWRCCRCCAPHPSSASPASATGVLSALADGGLTGTDAVHAFDTLLMFTFGSVLWEIPRTSTVRERLIAVAAHDPASALIAERAGELAHRDPTEYFRAGLAIILDGIRAQARAPRKRRS
ncbi:MAG: hypothetical protein E6G06_13485 [Actinobacteria bacterium]|nr:MAG: hypothetical protein E6G06_13485 [Actinomycetota bacterium]